MKHRQTKTALLFCLLVHSAIATAADWESTKNQVGSAAEFAGALVQRHSYLLEPSGREPLDEINRRLREGLAEIEDRELLRSADKAELSAKAEALIGELTDILKKTDGVIRVSVDRDEPKRPVVDPVELPGDTCAMLLRIDSGPGETNFMIVDINLAHEPGTVEIDSHIQGTTWALINLSGVPVDRTYLRTHLKMDDERTLTFPLVVFAAGSGRFKMNVLSDDTGEPIPSMVRLVWKTNGKERRPSNALDFVDQFDAQGSDLGRTGRRHVVFPEHLAGSYWCVPEPLDMMLPPGEWEIAIRRGLEHVPIVDAFTIESGRTIEKTYRPRRWVDMRKLGWYSGDDHVHCQILSDKDAKELMAWTKAEDLHVANIVKMGDIERTYFQQRGFDKDSRVVDGDYVLVPGQECPRTREIGHTLALNISSMVRDTEKYYLYDWVFDKIHAQGGLTGYAHAGSEAFQVHRDASINIPKEKVDFAEILQFAYLGTELYYNFLNLGFKLTASAGSDVPWGGTIGEVRIYAYTGEKPFSADAWFEAVRSGRTFVTNGPMLEFSVDKAIPGDEIQAKRNRPLRVRARAWGKTGNFVPTKLEIVRHGEVIKSLDSDDSDQEELTLDFTVKVHEGFWIAARAEAGDGSRAHTTPVYVSRDSLRFWKFDSVNQLLAKRLASLDEVEAIVEAAKIACSGGEGRKKSSGLVGTWYGGSDLTNPKDIDLIKTPKIDWNSARRGNSWSARWTGSIIAPYSGQVVFKAKADYGVVVEIDGKDVIHYEQTKGKLSGSLVVEKNKAYPIAISYFHERGKKSYLEILWSWAGQDETLISEKNLFYTGEQRNQLQQQFGLTREKEQLALQGDELLKRVEQARQIYEKLRLTYLKEQTLRSSIN
ncbi:MAG: CehA/McbA family metallohydrolase [Planctomycetota bacterium]|jgi:hypothetical protein